MEERYEAVRYHDGPKGRARWAVFCLPSRTYQFPIPTGRRNAEKLATRLNAVALASCMSEAEITRLVFLGAKPGEFRGLTDVFSLPEIQAISSNPDAGDWRWVAVTYLGSTR